MCNGGENGEMDGSACDCSGGAENRGGLCSERAFLRGTCNVHKYRGDLGGVNREHREGGRRVGGWRGWVWEVIGHAKLGGKRGRWAGGARGRLVFTHVEGVHSGGVGM